MFRYLTIDGEALYEVMHFARFTCRWFRLLYTWIQTTVSMYSVGKMLKYFVNLSTTFELFSFFFLMSE